MGTVPGDLSIHLKGNDPEGALQTLDLCESVIRKYAGDDTLDYGIGM